MLSTTGIMNVGAQEISGKVVGITDGDTITILDDNKRQTKIRLGEIDTPEDGQPFSQKAKQQLSDLVFGKNVTVTVQDTDKYGRTVGRVYVDGIDVNAELVAHGAAWVYRQYAKDQKLFALEEKAKKSKEGLWSLPESERVPPWEWRRGTTGTNPLKTGQLTEAKPVEKSSGQGFTCGGKTTCKQMVSCAEARFYLEKCGLGRLDRDKDGTPCESICR